MRLPKGELDEREAAVHALDRLAFGRRPGDVERLKGPGLASWIERQLEPAKIKDAELERRLAPYETAAASTEELVKRYPNPFQFDPRRGADEELRRRQDAEADAIVSAHPGSRLQRSNFLGENRILSELALAKLTRAVHSERQLLELMTDFWFNHFNVHAGKAISRWLLPSFERDALRPHALGRFRDLLGATAAHPAMLHYLDNWMNADPNALKRLGASSADAGALMEQIGADGGRLNENYARELLELHTLGVDGGYTQADVIEVARCFTGWTIRRLYEPVFVFQPALHDPDPKTVLGRTIAAGGAADGERVLDLLAAHPSTARFVSTKIARRFVADDPPPALVARMAEAFLKSDGDIRSTLRAMLESPEFWSRAAYRAKVKRPFELVASAARALGAELEPYPMSLLGWADLIGELVYRNPSPAGYPDRMDLWTNAGAMLRRVNFATVLARGFMDGVKADADKLLAGGSALDVVLGGEASAPARAALERWRGVPQLAAALALGSPEFQRK